VTQAPRLFGFLGRSSEQRAAKQTGVSVFTEPPSVYWPHTSVGATPRSPRASVPAVPQRLKIVCLELIDCELYKLKYLRLEAFSALSWPSSYARDI